MSLFGLNGYDYGITKVMSIILEEFKQNCEQRECKYCELSKDGYVANAEECHKCICESDKPIVKKPIEPLWFEKIKRRR